MKIFKGFDSLRSIIRPTATIGSFDGVHRGHAELLRTVTDTAHANGGESLVFTFEPHPRITLGQADGLTLLTTFDEKVFLMERAGIDNIAVIPFDKAFSRVSPEGFIRDYIIERAGVETLVVGYNHRFGRNKQGSYHYLGHNGFGMRIIEVPECDVDAMKVSSTAVRKLIGEGAMTQAAKLLGHPYIVIGESESGHINIAEPLKALPPAGTYEVSVNGRSAVAAVGDRQITINNGDTPDGRVAITF